MNTKNNIDYSKELKNLAERLDVKDIKETLFFPKYFQVETSSICNAKCKMCVVPNSKKKNLFMSESVFKIIADQLGNYSDWVIQVCLSRGGEPLMDNRLSSKVSYLKKTSRIKKVNITTNGSLLTEEKAYNLLNAGIDEVQISIDSINEEVYEKIRIGLNFEETLKNIIEFIKLRDKIRPATNIRIRMVALEENKDEINEWTKFWRNRVKITDRVDAKLEHNWGNQLKDVVSINNGLTYKPCISLWSTMNITSDGIVALCCADNDGDVVMGNVLENSLVDIWHSSKFTMIRKLHEDGMRNKILLCRGCKIWD